MKYFLGLPFFVILLTHCSNSKPAGFKVESLNNEPTYINPEKSKRGTVLYFIQPDCPLSQLYAMSVNQLYSFYQKKGYDFYGIVPGDLYPVSEVKLFVEDFVFLPPVYLDKEKLVSTHFGVKVVPDVVLIDKNGKVIYSGKIDDQAIDTGRKKFKATHFYLLDALKSHYEGKAVAINKTNPVGCYIE